MVFISMLALVIYIVIQSSLISVIIIVQNLVIMIQTAQMPLLKVLQENV